jgi:hypothetical protein
MREPKNYFFWLSVLKNPKEYEAFIRRADKSRLKEMKAVIRYEKQLSKQRQRSKDTQLTFAGI